MKKSYRDLQEMLADCLKNNTSKISFCGEYGIIEYTYQEVLERIQALAEHLNQLGIRAGDYVVLQIPTTRHYYFAVMTLFYMKAIPMGVPYCGNSEQYRRLCTILDSDRSAYVLADEMGMEFIKLHGNIRTDRLICLSERDFQKKSDKNFDYGLLFQRLGKSDSDVAIIQYSSGTTSQPKGIEVTHRGILQHTESVVKRSNCAEDEVWMCWLPLTHVLGLFMFSVLPIQCDYTVSLMETSYFLENPRVWFDELERIKATVSVGPNFAFKYMVDAIRERDTWDLSNIKILYNGSEPISKGILAEFLNVTKRFSLRKNCIFPGYGLTEATCACTINTHYDGENKDFKDLRTAIDFPIDNIESRLDDLTNLGSALEGVEIRIVNDDFVPQEEKTIGNIQLKGATLCNGYKEIDSIDLFTDGWLNTGDIGFLMNGELYIVGRKKDVIFIGGKNIFLMDLENVLQQHFHVRAAVCGSFSAEEAMPKIYVFMENIEGDLGKIKKEVHSLIRYNFGVVITDVTIMDKLCTTRTGKINKLAIMNEYNEKMRKNLSSANIMEKLTEVFGKKVSKDELLINILGDSIHTFEKIGEINKLFLIHIGMLEIMRCQTVEELANIIAEKSLITAKKESKEARIEYNRDEKEFTLTNMQEAYLLGREQEYHGAYNSTHLYAEVEHRFIIEKLETAVMELVRRHKMLRTIFNEGKQKTLLLEELPEYHIKTTYVGKEEQRNFWEKKRQENQRKIYDPSVWPLFQIENVNIDGKEILCIDLDMLIVDGFSVWVLIQDLVKIYNGEKLDKLTSDFSNYINLLSKRKEGRKYKEDKQFWLDKIPDFPEAPKLPYVSNNDLIQENVFVRLHREFNENDFEKLNAFACKNSVTPSIVLGYLYAYTLAKWSESKEFSINVTVFNRPDEISGIQDVVGDFTSSILLDIRQGDMDKKESKALRLFRDRLYEYYDHNYFEGCEVIREIVKSKKMRDYSAMPVVFTSMFFDKGVDFNLLGNIQYAHSQTSQVSLDNQILKFKEGFSVRWDYLKKVFSEGVINDMFEYYCSLIQAVIQGENIADVKIDSEIKLLEYNNSDIDRGSFTLCEMLKRSFKKHANNVAINVLEGENITYKELKSRSQKIITYLKTKRVFQGDYVIVKFEDKNKAAVVITAVVLMGAAYIPIPYDYPQERINFIAEKSKSKLILDANMIYDFVDDFPETNVENDTSVSDLNPAYVIYTSGSTGKPKGVVINCRGLLNTICDINERMNISETSHLLGISAFNFDLSCYDIFGTFISGAKVTFISDPREMDEIEMAINSGVTVWNSVPAIMELFLMHRENKKSNYTLKSVMLSGDWIGITLPDKVKTHFPNAELYSLGGATEASIWSIYYRIDGVSESWTSIPYGYPMSNQKIYVLDETLNVCPYDVVGEIYIGGEGIATEYLGDIQSTEAAFIDTKMYGRIYKTGDCGIFRREGFVEFIGRKDNQVKVFGYRIELNEIKAALLSNTNIKEAVVATDSKNHLLVYYVSDKEFNSYELQNSLRKTLPEYMIPQKYVKLKNIPLTENGKVDYRALQKYNTPQVNPISASNSDIEHKMEKIWCSVLGLDHINSKADFFEMGGDSLTAQKIAMETKRIFGVKLTINSIIKEGTIEKICTLIRNELNVETRKEEKKDKKTALYTFKELFELQEQRYNTLNGKRIHFGTSEYQDFKQEVLTRYNREYKNEYLLSANEEKLPDFIKNRRSIREFDSQKIIKLSDFENIMLMLKQRNIDGKIRYFYPSSGGLYAIDIYLYIKKNRVENLPEGFYFYNPAKHAIEKLKLINTLSEKCHYFNNREIYKQSAFSVLFVYNADCNMPLYGGMGNYNALVDAGVIAAQLTQAGCMNGIGSCSIGDMDFESIKEILALNETQYVIHAMEFGVEKEKQTKFDFPQTGIQEAYIKGKNDKFELGKYGAHYYMEIETIFSPKDIEDCINALVKRHGLLRTIFMKETNMQREILDPGVYNVEVVSCGNSEKEWNNALFDIRNKLSHYNYKYDEWPLFTFKVLQNSYKRVLAISMSLLICDGASFQILIREMWSFLKHKAFSEKLSYSFGEYAEKVMNLEKQDATRYEDDKAYWKEKIKNFPETPKLPMRCPISLLKEYHIERKSAIIDTNLWTKVKQEGRDKRLSASTILCTIFAKVLSLWSNQKRLAIDLTVFERLPFHEDVEKIIGDFTKLIPLSISFDDNLENTANQIQESILEGMEHLRFDGIEVLQELAKGNGTTGKANLPIVFTSMLFDSPVNYFEKIGQVVYAVSQTPQVFLDCQVMEMEGKLYISWDYVVELFEADLIEKIFEDFINTIKEFSFEKGIDVVKQRIAKEWEGYNKKIKEGSDDTLINWFQVAAQKYPDNTAITGGGKQYTYKNVEELSNRVAHYLCAHGICGNHARVCVLAEREPETIITILGILKTGAAYVPVSCDYPKERQEYIYKNCESVAMLSTQIYKDDLLYNYEDTSMGIVAQPDWLAYIIYTSGSTGNPKGVMISHRAACNTIKDVNRMTDLSEKDCVLGLSSLCFDLSVYDVFGTLSVGGKLVVIQEQRDMKHIAQLLESEKITVWNSVPEIMSTLITHIKNRKKSKNYLRYVLLSGDWIPLTLPNEIRETLGNAKIISLGGATEAAIWSIYYPIQNVEHGWNSIPYGYPMSNQAMYIMDYDMELCIPGVIGEICIGGEGLAVGYVNDLDKTGKCFIQTKKYGRIYRTGDLGVYHQDGYIEILGRIDNQVKIRGYRIELTEIEIALQKYKDIKECAVSIYEQEPNHKSLIAYVVMKEADLNQQRLIQHLEQILPKYMIPRQFVELERLPRNSNGKIDKKRLPKPQIKYSKTLIEGDDTNEIQSRLIEIWKKEFQLESIGIQDNFFDLGGDSITMMKMVEDIYNIFKVEISIEDILECENVEELSAFIEKKCNSPILPIW